MFQVFLVFALRPSLLPLEGRLTPASNMTQSHLKSTQQKQWVGVGGGGGGRTTQIMVVSKGRVANELGRRSGV